MGKLPELNSCCGMPLRFGLIACGYIKLVFSLVFAAKFGYFAVSIVRDTKRPYPDESTDKLPKISGSESYDGEILYPLVITLFLFFEVCFSVVFLVGGYRKNANLLFTYYIYSIVVLCMYIGLLLVATGLDLLYLVYGFVTDKSWLDLTVLTFLFVGIMFIVFQFYIIVLVRSEINKLNRKSKNINEVASENETTEP